MNRTSRQKVNVKLLNGSSMWMSQRIYIIKANISFRQVLIYLQYARKIFLSIYRKVFKMKYSFSYVILSSLVQTSVFLYLVFIYTRVVININCIESPIDSRCLSISLKKHVEIIYTNNTEKKNYY